MVNSAKGLVLVTDKYSIGQAIPPAFIRGSKMITRLNIQTHPKLKEVYLGNVDLSRTNHAGMRAYLKGFDKLLKVKIGCGAVVEAEVDNYTQKVVKIVVRVPYNIGQDIVLVLVPPYKGSFYEGWLIVKTAWLNSKSDTHATLDRSRLGQVG